MINLDDYTNENKAEHNPKWPYIPDNPCREVNVGGSGSGKTLFNFHCIIRLDKASAQY